MKKLLILVLALSILIISGIVSAFTIGPNLILNPDFSEIDFSREVNTSIIQNEVNETIPHRGFAISFPERYSNNITSISVLQGTCYANAGADWVITFYASPTNLTHLFSTSANFNTCIGRVNINTTNNIAEKTSFVYILVKDNIGAGTIRVFNESIDPAISFYRGNLNDGVNNDTYFIEENRELTFTLLSLQNNVTPKNWFYVPDFNTINFGEDQAAWNISIFNLINNSLFFNVGSSVYGSAVCNEFLYPVVKTQNLSINPSSRYAIQFDVKANVIQNGTNICGDNTTFPPFFATYTKEQNGKFNWVELSNASEATSGTNQIGIAETSFEKSLLIDLGDGRYRFYGEFVTESTSNMMQVAVVDDSAEHSHGTWLMYDNFSIRENVPLPLSIWDNTTTTIFVNQSFPQIVNISMLTVSNWVNAMIDASNITSGKLASARLPSGSMILINSDEIQNSGSLTPNACISKTYNLPANSYSKIVAEGEGYVNGTSNNVFQANISLLIGPNSSNPVFVRMDSLGPNKLAQIPFSVKYTNVSTSAANITIKICDLTGNFVVALNSLRVYGVV